MVAARLFLERAPDDRRCLIEVEWLDEVIERTSFERPHCGFQVAERRDHDDRHPAEPFAERPHCGQAVHSRQPDVEHDDVQIVVASDLQTFLGRGGDLDLVAQVAERFAKGPADACLVIHDQDAAH